MAAPGVVEEDADALPLNPGEGDGRHQTEKPTPQRRMSRAIEPLKRRMLRACGNRFGSRLACSISWILALLRRLATIT